MVHVPPSMNPTAASRFAEHLKTHQSTITEAWVQAVKSDREIASSQKLTRSDLADHLPALFNDLIEYLQTSATEGTRQRIRQEAQRHGNQRWKQGYRLVELLRELGTVQRLLLRRGLLDFLQLHPEFSVDADDARELISLYFDDATIGSVEQYVQNYGAQLSETSHSLAEANDRLLKTDGSRLALIRTISHDLGNFLTSLTWVVEAFGFEADEAERAKMLEVTKRNLADMSSLVRELTDYSVLLAGDVKAEFEPISLYSLCEEIKESLTPMVIANDLSLEVTNQAGMVWTDPRKLKQIVANLVSNAIKYRRRDKADGFVRLVFESADEEDWQLTVADSGVGIPQEDLQKVFEEFQRGAPSEKIQGAGLGLAITKRLVLLLNGEISVSSEVGQGTQFVLTFSRNCPNPSSSAHSRR
ncbi:MAG: sensor histidine kinase [Chthoniobacterales bacterium]